MPRPRAHGRGLPTGDPGLKALLLGRFPPRNERLLRRRLGGGAPLYSEQAVAVSRTVEAPGDSAYSLYAPIAVGRLCLGTGGVG